VFEEWLCILPSVLISLGHFSSDLSLIIQQSGASDEGRAFQSFAILPHGYFLSWAALHPSGAWGTPTFAV
jgi:hypothetical protein